MPELPEIASRCSEMQVLAGRTIQAVDVMQPKCLNLEAETFAAAVEGAKIEAVSYRGKWIFIRTDRGWILINLGMGGEILLVPAGADLPEKRRLVFTLTDGARLALNFWWFGYVHFVALERLGEHEMTARLGPNALDLTAEDFKRMFAGQRGRIKAVLLDQTKMAGIGNAYIHDILFLAGLHPLRVVNTLSEAEIARLVQAIHKGLLPSLEKGGAFYELNLYGQKGGFVMEDILIAYRENQPCPVCGMSIQKIKTGSNAGYFCPECQPIP